MPEQNDLSVMIPSVGEKAALAAMVAAGGIFATATAHLWKSGFSPGPGNVRADYIAAEADYSGYLSQALGTGAVFLNAEGRWVAIFDTLIFPPAETPLTVENTLGGIWIDDAASVLLSFEFAEPVTISASEQYLDADLKVYANLTDSTLEIDY